MSGIAVGIDIGTESVKVVCLKGSGRYSLVGLNYVKIPAQSWQADVLQNSDEIAKAIRDSLNSAKPNRITSKIAMVALPESVIFTSTISVPKMKPKDLANSIPFTAADHLSLNIEDCYFDWQINGDYVPIAPGKQIADIKDVKTGKTEESKKEPTSPASSKDGSALKRDEPSYSVFVVAAKKTLVDSVIETINKAGLVIGGIDIKPSAITRAIIPTNDNVSRMIIDLGSFGTGISIIKGYKPELTSSVLVGAKDILDPTTKQMLANGKAKLDQVFDEVVHGVRYYENRLAPGKKIQDAMIVGIGANIPDIEKILKEETGINAKIGDPFIKVKSKHLDIPTEIKRSYSDAIGLAMRRDGDD